MPLCHGTDDTMGRHGYYYYKYVPFDWSDSPNPTARVDYSRTFVMNTLEPYVKNDQIMSSPGMDEYLYRASVGVVSGKKKGTTTYAYNGLLHAYDHEAIVSVENLTLFTAANGNRVGVGAGFANPALKCNTPYEPCFYHPRLNYSCQVASGGKGAMYTKYDGDSSSYWLYKKGQNWAFNDSHAKFRRVGSTLSPNRSDPETDPWVFYNDEGHAGSYYWDGCHPYLFRPDYTFDN